MRKETVEYNELQPFRQWWMWLIMIGVDMLFAWGCIQQLILKKPWGDRPMGDTELIIITLIMVLLNVAMFISRLHTYIDEKGIYVKFFPLQIRYKFYDWNAVQTAYIRKYRPLTQFDGWGFRISLNAEKAYTMSGNMGLQLILRNGKKVLIGTNQPEHLAEFLTKLGKMKE